MIRCTYNQEIQQLVRIYMIQLSNITTVVCKTGIVRTTKYNLFIYLLNLIIYIYICIEKNIYNKINKIKLRKTTLYNLVGLYRTLSSLWKVIVCE